jgi:orotate phosphoribosyltransferase
MHKTSEEWIEEYRLAQALYIHDGTSMNPHPCLSSELHSSGFFDGRKVIKRGDLMVEAASDLVELFLLGNGELSQVHGVIGPQTGATRLAELVSERISQLTGRKCVSASPAKYEQAGVKSMVFSGEEFGLVSGKTILLCEDALSKGGSVRLAVTAALNAGCHILPYILVMVNRSGFDEMDGRKIISLINHPMPMWEPNDCPLCRLGSPAIKNPKDNWEHLTATC